MQSRRQNRISGRAWDRKDVCPGLTAYFALMGPCHEPTTLAISASGLGAACSGARVKHGDVCVRARACAVLPPITFTLPLHTTTAHRAVRQSGTLAQPIVSRGCPCPSLARTHRTLATLPFAVSEAGSRKRFVLRRSM